MVGVRNPPERITCMRSPATGKWCKVTNVLVARLSKRARSLRPTMNIYILFPAIALFVNLVMWVYVFAQQKKDPVNAAFLLFSTCALGWIILDLLMFFPLVRGYERIVANVGAFFWIPCGFWFLVFAYALLNKRRDWKLYAAGVSAAAGVLIVVLTDSVVVGFQRYSWGTTNLFHPIYHPLISSITAVTSAYAVLLILQKRASSSDRPRR